MLKFGQVKGFYQHHLEHYQEGLLVLAKIDNELNSIFEALIDRF